MAKTQRERAQARVLVSTMKHGIRLRDKPKPYRVVAWHGREGTETKHWTLRGALSCAQLGVDCDGMDLAEIYSEAPFGNGEALRLLGRVRPGGLFD